MVKFKDSHRAKDVQVDRILKKLIEISNILASSIMTLKGKM
jgi:hypothetical protein